MSGISVRWILSPPETIKVGQEFNATTELIISPEFYEWGMTENLFQNVKSGSGVA